MSLYGGAITAALPSDAIDVSEFRQVPDTQEVFLLEKPNGLDQSLIFDLLERVDAQSLPEVIAVHLDDILEGPPSFLVPIESMKHPNLECETHTFLVKPAPSKQETDSTKLFMFVVLVRIEKVATDLVITMNVPVASGAITAEVFQQMVDSVLDSQSLLGGCYGQVKESALSVQVVDWNLFG